MNPTFETGHSYELLVSKAWWTAGIHQDPESCWEATKEAARTLTISSDSSIQIRWISILNIENATLVITCSQIAQNYC